jgi:hypothetical protein
MATGLSRPLHGPIEPPTEPLKKRFRAGEAMVMPRSLRPLMRSIGKRRRKTYGQAWWKK